MKLYIKYMVSLRCKLFVKQTLDNLGVHYTSIELGMVETKETLNDEQLHELKANLASSGLKLLDDKRSILIDRIKNVVIEMVHYAKEVPKVNYSDFISEQLGYDYTYLSNVFSQVKGITIQHFIIKHKIEKAKELMLYDELNLTEISYRLHYSSVAHLSNQFKKVTGHSPSYFKKLGKIRKSNLENL